MCTSVSPRLLKCSTTLKVNVVNMAILAEIGRPKSLRMNTYEKTGEGCSIGISNQKPLEFCFALSLSLQSAKCTPFRSQLIHPYRPCPLAGIPVPDFSMTENCRLRTDDSSPSSPTAAGRFLPSSATLKGLVLLNLSSAGTDMAMKCDLCGKGPQYGNVVSHANNTRRRRWNPNLKRVRAVVAGTHKHLRVCTACIRAGKVIKAGASRAPKAA